MTRDDVLELCGSFPGATKDFPFGGDVAVFKVGGRMFALVLINEDPGWVTLKCHPDLALELRDRFPAVRPGYHSNKRHWNTVELDSSIESDELSWMIEHSYELVVSGLPRSARQRLSSG
jgi:predicted DNA-binding protein (MmcQ/YjbR family)